MSELIIKEVKIGEEIKIVYITVDSELKGFELSNLLWDQEEEYPYHQAFEDGWEICTIHVYAEADDLEVHETMPLCWVNDRAPGHVMRITEDHKLIERALTNLKSLILKTKEGEGV